MRESLVLGTGFHAPQLWVVQQPGAFAFLLPLNYPTLNRIEEIREKDVHLNLEARVDYRIVLTRRNVREGSPAPAEDCAFPSQNFALAYKIARSEWEDFLQQFRYKDVRLLEISKEVYEELERVRKGRGIPIDDLILDVLRRSELQKTTSS